MNLSKTPPLTTELVIVLDRSGSMQPLRDTTVRAYNRFLADQREQPGEARLTLVQFDDVIETLYAGVPLEDVPNLTQRRYQPRGSTALLDAMGRTILATQHRIRALPTREKPHRTLVMVLTDGKENASVEFTRDRVFKLIRQHRDHATRPWHFIFLGADMDGIADATRMGISDHDNLQFCIADGNMERVMNVVSQATSRYRADLPKERVDPFFTDQERTELVTPQPRPNPRSPRRER